MMSASLLLKQTDVVQRLPKRPSQSKKDLPTMYDLPSEDPKEPGLPDEFHYYQPQLLRETFCPPNYPSEKVLVASDLNLYYDADYTERYKRPDWMAVVGVSRLYEERELRMSYVMWQEKEVPFIVIELLSPSSQKEDLGKTLRDVEEPPTKWEVYERILGIPYYIVYSRKLDYFRAFQQVAGYYQELNILDKQLWMPEISLGLGIWSGAYQDIEHDWLRWYNVKGKWITTQEERIEEGIQRAEKEKRRAVKEKHKALQEKQRADDEKQRAEQEKQHALQEKQRADQEKQRAEQLAAQLRALGIEPNV